MFEFNKFHLKEYINLGLKNIGFNAPTKIQDLVIPRALTGESLVVESATGSGKTHSFLIPILENLDEDLNEVQTIIISPTRELATQLYNCLVELAKYKETINVARIIGGADREAEIKRFEKNQPQIVVGTIGRISDLAINSNVLKVHTAKQIVIDEADMIFDQKELIEVDKLIGKIQGEPQFLIFSATIPKGLRIFLNKYLSRVKSISIKEEKLTHGNINHIMVPCKAKNKYDILKELLNTINPYLAIIFANTKENVDELAMNLANDGYRVGKLHGAMEDRIRKQMIRRIHNLEFQYVVASDIAARGIDIQGVSHVINFDLPNDIEFYIHRTGRTARFDQTGNAYSLYAYEDDEYIKNLQAKGLKTTVLKIVNGEFVDAKILRKSTEKSKTVMIEEEVHKKIPVPKKVKPGYKKKRKELIEKTIKKVKKERIQEIYRQKARKERGK
mgnify:CR=1 FL=1